MPQAIIVDDSTLNGGNFVLNTQQQPWTDIRVRGAVHLAIDRQAAIDVLTQCCAEIGGNVPGERSIRKEELLKMPGWQQPRDIVEARRPSY